MPLMQRGALRRFLPTLAASSRRAALRPASWQRHCASTHDGGQNHDVAADDVDLFDIVDSVAADHPNRPVSTRSARHAARGAQPNGPAPPDVPATAAAAAGGELPDNSSSPSAALGRAGATTDRAATPEVMEAVRNTKARLEALYAELRSQTAEGGQGRGVGLAKAEQALSRSVTKYTLGFARQRRRDPAAAAPAASSAYRAQEEAPLEVWDTVEWAESFVATASTFAELRERTAVLRGVAHAVAQGGQAPSVEVAARGMAIGTGAVYAAIRLHTAKARPARDALATDSRESPVAVFAAALKDAGGAQHASDDLWAAGFSAMVAHPVSERFFDRLLEQFLEARGRASDGDDEAEAEAAEPATSAGAAAAPAPLDVRVVEMAMAFGSQRRDVERVLRVFSAYLDSLPSTPACPAASTPGLPLRLYARVLRSVEGTRFDGGIRAAMVRGLRATLTEPQLRGADWRDIASLLSGLDVSSAVSLVRFASGGRDERVPYAVWLVLLRRMCREGREAEAEAMHRLLRTRFHQTSSQRLAATSELLRMYCSGPRRNFDAGLALFASQIAEAPASLRAGCPAGTLEAPISPALLHYRLLLRAVDSPDAAHALWLECLADGLAPDAAVFRELIAAASPAAVGALRRQLPDLLPSELDAQLRVPADVDAHSAREQALAAMGKPVDAALPN